MATKTSRACAGCATPQPAKPTGAVIVAPNGRAGWVCAACCNRAARDPAWAHGCEVAVTTGTPHVQAVKVFASLGLEPPTDAAGVAANLAAMMRGQAQ